MGPPPVGPSTSNTPVHLRVNYYRIDESCDVVYYTDSVRICKTAEVESRKLISRTLNLVCSHWTNNCIDNGVANVTRHKPCLPRYGVGNDRGGSGIENKAKYEARLTKTPTTCEHVETWYVDNVGNTTSFEYQ